MLRPSTLRLGLLRLGLLRLGLLRERCLSGAATIFLLGLAPLVYAAGEGELEIRVLDKDTQKPLAVRMHLKDSKGKPVIPPKTVAWKDHFAFDGQITLKLRPGNYSFEVERGPEYRLRFGNFVMDKKARDSHTIIMERFVDMKGEGWWAGDLHIHRPPGDIELLMRAEDLYIAPVITWWSSRKEWEKPYPADERLIQFDDHRFYHLMAGEDERNGGALLYFNLDTPLPIQGLGKDFPPEARFLPVARQQPQAHIDIEKPFWWDMPVWVASGQVDSIGLANNHLWRDGGLHTEAWGRARDKSRYPDPHGNGRWSQDIYYHLLNCGIRLPPSAGSASGVLNNPVGYNRVYVHCGDNLTWENWWQGLREGKVIVTNGPLLRPHVNGKLPGHVFSAAAGQSIKLDMSLQIGLREKVDYLEVIKDGKIAQSIRLQEYVERQGKLPAVEFTESGWMLVRAVTNNEKTYRYGSTGPYYVQIGDRPAIRRDSAQFFVDWVDQRIEQIRELDDAAQRAESLEIHRQAQEFWRDKLAQATTE